MMDEEMIEELEAAIQNAIVAEVELVRLGRATKCIPAQNTDTDVAFSRLINASSAVLATLRPADGAENEVK